MCADMNRAIDALRGVIGYFGAVADLAKLKLGKSRTGEIYRGD